MTTSGLRRLPDISRSGAAIARHRNSLTLCGTATGCAIVIAFGASVRGFSQLASLHSVSPCWTAAAVLGELGSMLALTRFQRRLFAVGGLRMPLHHAAAVVAADTALSLSVPGGTIVGSGYARRRALKEGGDPELVSVVSWIALILVFASYSLVIGGGTMASGNVVLNGLGVGAVVAGLVLTAVAVQYPQSIARLARVGVVAVHPRAWLETLAHRLERLHMSRVDWMVTFVLASSAAVADAICLYASGRAIGAPGVSVGTTMLAYAAVQTAISIPLTPGGIGLAEVGVLLALVGSHVPGEWAFAWTIAYRLISFWGVLTLGWLCYVFLRLSDMKEPANLRNEGGEYFES